jgi:hypothetical protein
MNISPNNQFNFRKKGLLVFGGTPLSSLHSLSGEVTAFILKDQQKPQTSSVLCGQRVRRYPFICLTTQRSMGPYRHILSQMVVAGTMTVQPPFIPDQSAA